MFTLPVESWKIVLAKALAAVLMIHISLIVGIFSIGILAGELTFLKAVPKFLEECFNLIIAGFKEDAGMTVHVILFFLEGLLAMIAAWFATVYHLPGHGPGPAGGKPQSGLLCAGLCGHQLCLFYYNDGAAPDVSAVGAGAGEDGYDGGDPCDRLCIPALAGIPDPD